MTAPSPARIDDSGVFCPNVSRTGVLPAGKVARGLLRLANTVLCAVSLCAMSLCAGSAVAQTRAENEAGARTADPVGAQSAGQNDGANEPSDHESAESNAAVDASETHSPEEASNTSADEQFFSFAFQQTPWPDVLRQFAEWNNLTLDLTDVPDGAFSYIDNRRHTAPEAIDVLNGYLLPRGYVVVRRDRFLAVLKTDNPLLPNLVPTIPVEQLHRRGENELLRVVVPLEDIDPESAAEEIEQLLGAHGTVAPLATSQSLVVQGFGRNLRDVVALLGQAVPPATDDKLDFRAFPLTHLPAADAEQQIRQLFGLGSGTMNVSRASWEIERRANYRSRDRRGRDRDDDDDDRRPTGPVPLLAHLAMNMQVSALPRNNCLLVTATPAGLQLVEQVLTSIDVPQTAAAATLVGNAQPELRVYVVNDASEQEVAMTLEVIMPGVVVNEDGRQDAIHVFATPAEHARVAELVRTLDGGGQGGSSIEVIPLTRNDPFTMATLLEEMFDNERRDERPVIQAEPRSKTLVVRGSQRQVEQVRAALAAYGEGGAAARGPRLRSVAVERSAAEPLARFVQEVLAQDREFDNPIRVIVPGGQNADSQPPADESTTRSSGETGSEEDRTAALPLMRVASMEENVAGGNSAGAGDSAQRGSAPAGDVHVEDDDCNSSDDGGGAVGQPVPADDAGTLPRVNIEVRDGKLYLYSMDESALDEVEATIRELLAQMPQRTRWTVFYLRAADAAATATQLYQLVSDYSYSAFAGLGAASVDSAAEPLRIIADARLNALFVSGSEEQVAEIERFLELLDSVDLPESARERLPRAIFVRYADVNDMADMIRTLYQDHLTDPATQRRDNDRRDNDRRDNGGRDDEQDEEQPSQRDQRGESRGRRPQGSSPGVRLTLTVDELTSQLIVSCDEPLFRQIAKLVKERDEAARGTHSTMRMVRLGAAAPANLVEILQNMSPKITARTVVAPTPQTAPVATGSPESRTESPFRRDRSRSIERD